MLTRQPTRVILAALAIAATAWISACGATQDPSVQPSRVPASLPASSFSTHAFPRLESLIPTTIGGATLQTTSLRPTPALTTEKTQQLLDRLGRTIEDVEIASGSAPGVDVAIGVFRIKGADAAQMLTELRAIDEADPESQVTYGETQIANRTVVTRTIGPRTEHVYGFGDILFDVAGNPTLVNEVLAKLP